MLTKNQRSFLYQYAYLPEHLPDYVEAVSGSRAHLYGNYLCFSRGNHLTFIGYPLGKESEDLSKAYESVCKQSAPSTVAVIAPRLWMPPRTYKKPSTDSYYRLDLPLGSIAARVAYMIRRAERELRITEGRFNKEHQRLVDTFLCEHPLIEEQRFIFHHIPHYLQRSPTARLLEARKGDTLMAFTIVDVGSADYAFYLFTLRSVKHTVPGASDLLFHEMVRLAQSEGKRSINLGLGVHPGIRRFKEKWGGVPFLPYASAFIQRRPLEMGALAQKL